MKQSFITITNFYNKNIYSYPHESENTMLFTLIVLILFTFFIGFIGIPFNQEGIDILTKWLTPSINFLHENLHNFLDWYEFVINAIFSVSIAYLGIFVAFFLYKPIYSSLINFYLINSFDKIGSKRFFWDKIINIIYNWSSNRGYIDSFYATYLIRGVRGLAELVYFFDKRIIDGILNGFGVTSFLVAEGIKYVGGGRISSHLFLYLFYVLIFLYFVS